VIVVQTGEIADARHVAEQKEKLDVHPPVGKIPEDAHDGCTGHDRQHQADDVAQHLVASDAGEIVGYEAHERGHDISS
jgi:hypothetical protein